MYLGHMQAGLICADTHTDTHYCIIAYRNYKVYMYIVLHNELLHNTLYTKTTTHTTLPTYVITYNYNYLYVHEIQTISEECSDRICEYTHIGLVVIVIIV